jgi:hypothetical protein
MSRIAPDIQLLERSYLIFWVLIYYLFNENYVSFLLPIEGISPPSDFLNIEGRLVVGGSKWLVGAPVDGTATARLPVDALGSRRLTVVGLAPPALLLSCLSILKTI